jgi:hypothetical protein
VNAPQCYDIRTLPILLSLEEYVTRQTVYYNLTLRRVRETIVAEEKQYSVCVCVCVCVALRIRHAARMLRIAVCGLSGSTIFCTLSHKWHDIFFWGGESLNI